MPTSSKICCPDGYSYVDKNGMYFDTYGNQFTIGNTASTSPTYAATITNCAIIANLIATSVVDSQNCPCCPDNYTYVAQDLPFWNAGIYMDASGNVLKATQMIAGTLANICALTAPLIVGTVYYSVGVPGQTQGSSEFPTTFTIPCITCNCETLPDPTCPTCGTSGVGIHFSWDFTKSNCTTCPPQDVNNPPGCIQKFLPVQYLDPVTSTFVLRNKNFI